MGVGLPRNLPAPRLGISSPYILRTSFPVPWPSAQALDSPC
jgi:hypothetical protein